MHDDALQPPPSASELTSPPFLHPHSQTDVQARPLSFNSRLANLEDLSAQVRARLEHRKKTLTAAGDDDDNDLQEPSPVVVHATSSSASVKSVDTAASSTANSPAHNNDIPHPEASLTERELALLRVGTSMPPKKSKKASQQKRDQQAQDQASATSAGTKHESDPHDEDDDDFASAGEDEPVTAPEEKNDHLAPDHKPAFAQTRSLVDVTVGDDDDDDDDGEAPNASHKEETAPAHDRPSANKEDENAFSSTPRPESTSTFPTIEIPLDALPPRPQDLHDEIAPEDMNERPPSPPKRKFTSPFSFFSRTNTSKSPERPRRDTVSSAATETDDGSGPKKPNRASLRDRFKLLRMQEEAGVVLDDDNEARPVSPSKDTAADASSHADDAESISRKRHSSGARNQPANAPPVNEHLPPGTAAGTVTGPDTQTDEAVDWDLWQAVVYEGPAAVARSSEAELNTAITKGIPSAIRGVVWQVLAQSKNEDLEAVYRELVARGGEDAKSRRLSASSKRPSVSRPQSTAGSIAPSLRGETISEQSEDSDDAAASASKTPNGDVSSPTSEAHTVDFVKAQAKIAAEEKRKAKDEAAALSKLEKAIKRDLGARTSYSKFLMSQGLQNGLFGICKAYALFDEEVGYAQGMNFIAMPLLFNMPEEEAFTLFVRLMNHYKLRDLFVADMPGLHLHLYQFARLLEDFEPALYCHLNRRQVHPQLYATQWFLTLFAYRFPLQLVLRIYDLILSEGLETAILKFGIVLMQRNATQLLEMRDMTVLTQYLKERLFDVYIDKSPSAISVLESGFFGSAGGIDKEVYRADQLVQDACSIKITKEMLARYTKEWEEKTREEKAAQLEKEALKSTNARLLLENKTLRERTDDLDTEHVTIASDLVRTKVNNQQLADDNEALRTQVKDLQGIITSQPGEVEDRLRQEMERIMQRNSEVQGQNRLLEEEREQVEMELVKAKMEKAEMGEELEKWKQKWHAVAGLMKDIPSP